MDFPNQAVKSIGNFGGQLTVTGNTLVYTCGSLCRSYLMTAVTSRRGSARCVQGARHLHLSIGVRRWWLPSQSRVALVLAW